MADHIDDYGLTRLFRSPFDHLPAEEQLKHYHQRDLMPSHVYRVGMKIFTKKPPIRRRIIEASFSFDGLKGAHKPLKPFDQLQHQRPSRTVQPTPTHGDDPRLQLAAYRDWFVQRRQMRETLESIGANEQWLMSKECTPIEATLLAKLKEERRLRNSVKPPPTPTETSGSEDEELSPAELRRLKLRERNQLIKEIRRLEKFIKTCRTRIAEFVVPYDTRRLYLIPTDLLIDYLERLQPPNVPSQTISLLCRALEKETGRKEEVIDYRKLFEKRLDALVLKHLGETSHVESVTSLDSYSSGTGAGAADAEDHSTTDSSELSSSNSHTMTAATLVDSTLDGETGIWANEVKAGAYRQFIALIEYCQQHCIVLNRKLAKKALLSPPDKSRQECLEQLRQPGIDLLARKDVEPPKEDREEEEDKGMEYMYGWQYQKLHGPLNSKLMRLPTGNVRVKAKTDNWLTFAEFEEITKEIQARPGFNYKYHGLPSNSAFWPGALQDKLRLYLPMRNQKSCSPSNAFQIVHHPKIYNITAPVAVNHQKGVIWPENESGRVQLGSSLARTKKTYIL